MDDQPFFVGQKAFLEKEGEVLVLFDKVGIDFPGGKLQEGEKDLAESLRREVREETGLEIEIGELFTAWIFEINLPGHKNFGKKIFALGYRCKYKSGMLLLSNEHFKYKWVNKYNYQDVDDGTEHFKALRKYFTGE